MKGIKAARLLGALFTGLVLIMLLALVVYAQEPGADEGEEPEGITGLGLSDPPPAGFSVIYMFSGAKDTQIVTATNTAATTVHCTNYGTISATVRVEISDKDNIPTLSGSKAINPNETATFSSQFTAFYFEDVPMATDDEINQGSGRVLVNNSAAKIICTAQILDPVNNPPHYAVKLTLYDGSGAPTTANKVYLPIILKNS